MMALRDGTKRGDDCASKNLASNCVTPADAEKLPECRPHRSCTPNQDDANQYAFSLFANQGDDIIRS